MLQSYLYRNYSDGRGMFYDGSKENAIYTFNSLEARKWRDENQSIMQRVSITIPPKKKISFMIPIVDEGEIDESFYDFVYDKKTDSILAGMLEIFLKKYLPVKGGKFKVNEKGDNKKYDSINLEKFQAMKDIIMGRFRVTPIKIPIGKDQDQEKYYDWYIGSDVYDVEYEYNGKKYKTNHFGLYASNFRKAMFADADDYEFYGGHRMQYWQRIKTFESGYVSYTNACRGIGKSILENFNMSIDLVRERVFLGEKTRPLLVLYYGETKENIKALFQYTLKMYQSLLLAIGGEKLFKKLIHYSVASGLLTLYDGTEQRQIRALSQNQSGSGSRPSYVCGDEVAKFANAENVIKEILGFGKCPVSFISTVRSETIRNDFYDNRSTAYKQMNKYEETMFDIVHDIRWKYGFGTCTKPEDYLKLAEEGVFNKARAELFRRRALTGFKFTLDDSEVKTEEEKELEIQSMLDSSGYAAVMAEFYGVVLSDRSVFKIGGNIVDTMPHNEDKKYHHIYFSYDEADEGDNPAVVVGGLYDGKIYVVESVKLTADLTKRYEDMKNLYEKRKFQSIGGATTIIADVNRGVTIREKIIEKLGKLDIPFIFTRTSAKEDWHVSDGKHIVNKGWLVKLMQNEYLPKGKIMIASELNNEGGLLEEMSNYIDKGNGKYEGDKKEKDDQITALLQVVYAAHLGYFKGIRDLGYDNMDYMEIRMKNIEKIQNAKKYEEFMKAKRDMLSKYF